MSKEKVSKCNPVAKDLRTPKYKPRVVESKKRKQPKKPTTKEIDDAFNF